MIMSFLRCYAIWRITGPQSAKPGLNLLYFTFGPNKSVLFTAKRRAGRVAWASADFLYY